MLTYTSISVTKHKFVTTSKDWPSLNNIAHKTYFDLH